MENKKFLFKTSSLFCTCIKLGNIKFMPGTFGSLVGLILGVLGKSLLSFQNYILIVIIIFILALFLISVYQSKKGKKDRSEIIIDEIIGQQIPLFFFELSLINILLSFIFFRFFDILKIFPASYIDKEYSNSLGIILDDIVAGIQASIIILFITLLL